MDTLLPKIIYEDETIIVIDKPAGLTVDRASTNRNVATVQDWIDNTVILGSPKGDSRIKEETDSGQARMTGMNDFYHRSGIVHRLDKETSGLLIIAKTKEAFINLQSQFKNREIIKKYLALVHGKVEPSQGVINVPIERNPYNKKKFGVFLGGRESVTEYRTLTNYRHSGLSRIDSGVAAAPQNDVFSLLEVSPHTGRTHQIRIHLKYINHPIVGDILYSGRKNIQITKKICPRMFLHAAYLKIKHPKTGKSMEFRSELPKELQETLDYILRTK